MYYSITVFILYCLQNLFHKYHTNQAIKGSLVKEGVFAEMLRQRQFLERSLHSLRNRVSVFNQKNNWNKKITEENVTLLETVNKLRADLVVNRSKFNTLNRIIGSSDNKLLTPKQAKHLLEKASKNVDEMCENYKDQIKVSPAAHLKLLSVDNNNKMIIFFFFRN